MADSERRARLIVETKNESSAQMGEINKSFGDVFQSVTGLNLASVSAAGAVGMVGAAIKDSIDKTIAWADEMDKMARITGMSTEEASKLSVVMGDFGINTSQLTVMIKKLSKEGIELNTDTLKALATEYQSLPSAVEKNTFAVKNFGRAGLEMTEILSKTPAQIDALTAAAERSGKVMNEAAVEGAQAYKLQLAQLNDQVEGVKIALGSELIPWLSKAVTGGQDYIRMWEAIAIRGQQAIGVMDDTTASLRAAELAGKSHAEALKEVYAAELATTDASDRLSESNTALADSYVTTSMATAMSAHWTAEGAQIQAEAADKTKALADATAILAAGLSGDLTRSQETYNQTVSDTQDKIDELRNKLARLGETQGQTVTVTKDATASQAELTLAQDKVIASTQKLSEAQAKLSENTDPEKQFQLQMAVDSAAVALENAQDKAFKFGGELGSVSTYTVDNTRKIAELHAELDPLIEKQDAAAKAARRATDEFIYQQLSADLDADSALKLAEKLGLIDPASAAATKAALALRAEYDKGHMSADTYASSAKGLADSIAALQSKNITITTTHITEEILRSVREQVNPGGYGYQHGTDFVIPPGFSENFPIGSRGASSGERVTVTPAGQTGTGMGAELVALIRALPGELRRAFREA